MWRAILRLPYHSFKVFSSWLSAWDVTFGGYGGRGRGCHRSPVCFFLICESAVIDSLIGSSPNPLLCLSDLKARTESNGGAVIQRQHWLVCKKSKAEPSKTVQKQREHWACPGKHSLSWQVRVLGLAVLRLFPNCLLCSLINLSSVPPISTSPSTSVEKDLLLSAPLSLMF